MDNPSENVEVANAPVTVANSPDLDEYQFLGEDPPQATAPATPTETGERPRDAQGRFLPQENQLEDLPVEPEPVQRAPIAPKHSPRMLRMAADLGISQDDATDYSPEQLEAVIHERQRQLINATRRPQEKPVEEAEPTIDLGINEDDFPQLVAHLKSEAKAKRELEKKIAFLENNERARQSEAVVSRWDRAFAKHAAILGEGTIQEVVAGSVSAYRRNAVSAVVLADQSQQSFQAKVDLAVKMLFGGAQAAPATRQAGNGTYHDEEVQAQRRIDATHDDVNGRLATRQAEWSEAGLAAPTQRAPVAEKPGVAAAKKAYMAEAKAAGFKVNYDPEDDTFEH